MAFWDPYPRPSYPSLIEVLVLDNVHLFGALRLRLASSLLPGSAALVAQDPSRLALQWLLDIVLSRPHLLPLNRPTPSSSVGCHLASVQSVYRRYCFGLTSSRPAISRGLQRCRILPFIGNEHLGPLLVELTCRSPGLLDCQSRRQADCLAF